MINFTYNKEKEVSIYEDYILTKKSPEVSRMVVEELEVPLDISNKYIVDQISYIQKQWEKVSTNFLKSLGDFYEIDLSTPNLTCYLTRLDIFPYRYNKNDNKEQWFSAPLFGNPAERNRVIMHELCHYFQPSPLPEAIKEAMPVILNDHKHFEMYSTDRGHQNTEEQKWRKIIWDMYSDGKKYKDIVLLLNEDNKDAKN